jgi:hypothetical protein
MKTLLASCLLLSMSACAAPPRIGENTSAVRVRDLVGSWHFEEVEATRAADVTFADDGSFVLTNNFTKNVHRGNCSYDADTMEWAFTGKDPVIIRASYFARNDLFMFPAASRRGHHGTIVGEWDFDYVEACGASESDCESFAGHWSIEPDGRFTAVQQGKTHTGHFLESGDGRYTPVFADGKKGLPYALVAGRLGLLYTRN